MDLISLNRLIMLYGIATTQTHEQIIIGMVLTTPKKSRIVLILKLKYV